MKTFSAPLLRRLRAVRGVRRPAEIALLARVYLGAPIIPLAMRLPLPRLERLLLGAARGRVTPRTRLPPDRVAEIVQLAQYSAHPIVRRGCITRGVSLFCLLRRSGLDVDLVFGIGGPADDFYGHCWLVRDGRPFLEPETPDTRFIEQYRIPTRTTAA